MRVSINNESSFMYEICRCWHSWEQGRQASPPGGGLQRGTWGFFSWNNKNIVMQFSAILHIDIQRYGVWTFSKLHSSIVAQQSLHPSVVRRHTYMYYMYIYLNIFMSVILFCWKLNLFIFFSLHYHKQTNSWIFSEAARSRKETQNTQCKLFQST